MSNVNVEPTKSQPKLNINTMESTIEMTSIGSDGLYIDGFKPFTLGP